MDVVVNMWELPPPRQDYRSVDGALDFRAEGRGFDSWDRTDTLIEKWEIEVLTLPYNGQVDWWSHLQKFSNFVLITLPLKLSPRFFPDLIGNLHTSDIFVFFFSQQACLALLACISLVFTRLNSLEKMTPIVQARSKLTRELSKTRPTRNHGPDSRHDPKIRYLRSYSLLTYA